jgi:hypothetical protein
MANSNESMRDRLLSRLPQPENAAEYRGQVAALLQRNERKLRQEKWYSGAIWIFVVLLAIALFWGSAGKPRAAEADLFALLFLIYGAVELLKHFINRSRVDLLKEIKQVQLQVLELEAAVRDQRR